MSCLHMSTELEALRRGSRLCLNKGLSRRCIGMHVPSVLHGLNPARNVRISGSPNNLKRAARLARLYPCIRAREPVLNTWQFLDIDCSADATPTTRASSIISDASDDASESAVSTTGSSRWVSEGSQSETALQATHSRRGVCGKRLLLASTASKKYLLTPSTP